MYCIEFLTSTNPKREAAACMQVSLRQDVHPRELSVASRVCAQFVSAVCFATSRVGRTTGTQRGQRQQGRPSRAVLCNPKAETDEEQGATEDTEHTDVHSLYVAAALLGAQLLPSPFSQPWRGAALVPPSVVPARIRRRRWMMIWTWDSTRATCADGDRRRIA
jgi:hypothetical protein